MRTLIVTFLMTPALALAGGSTLDISGACPGPMDISAAGLTPGGTAAVLTGSRLGGDIIPGGPCPGVVSDLGGLRFVTTVPIGLRGEVMASPTISAGLCSSYAQFLDVTTCTLTNAEAFGGGGDCVNLGWHAGPGAPEGYGWECPPGYRMPGADDEAAAFACATDEDLAYMDYYHNIATAVGGCGCKWNPSWCTYESVDTYDGVMCGDFDQLHVCLPD
jgi:hypothetical protein